jgi:acetyl/propionyl-CoA carboxylase alpha subunit
LKDQRFVAGDVDTALIAERGDKLTRRPPVRNDAVAMAAAQFLGEAMGYGGDPSPWSQLGGFRLNAEASRIVRMRLGDEAIAWDTSSGTTPEQPRGLNWLQIGHSVVVFDKGEAYEFTLDTGERAEGEVAAGDGAILSPMPGKIVSVAAKAGASLKKGDPILVLEAMKMEHTLTAPFDGKLAELNATPGAQVSEGVVLAKLDAL